MIGTTRRERHKSSRCHAVLAFCLLALLALSGCLGANEQSRQSDSDHDVDANLEPSYGWVSQVGITFATTGAYVIPYYAPTETPLNSTVTMDGGTWRGVRMDYVGQDGVALAADGEREAVNALRDWFEFRERARYVHEERENGVYEIECLGERENDTCLPYDNPSGQYWRADPWDQEPLYEGSLPPGHNYIILFAEFEDEFALNVSFDAPVWLGQHLETAEGEILSAELFRGELIDMVRCFMTGWCGSIVDGHYVIDKGDREYSLLFYYLSHALTVYGASCLIADDIEPHCAEDQPFAGVPRFFHTLTFSGNPPSGLRLNVDILGGSSVGWEYNRTFGHDFAMDGAVIWYDLPDQHPGLAAEVMEAQPAPSPAEDPEGSSGEASPGAHPVPRMVDAAIGTHGGSPV